ncbi:MAG: alpha/beta hydrolase [Muribaculaceae bacterium]|nr:alpha/beta hydrolase [Muribaculaceae bacterium]
MPKFKIALFAGLACMFATLSGYGRTWQSDTLIHAPGFQYTTINQPDDYAGKVVSTVIRKQAESPSDVAVLYVHGFNDYFFQSDEANQFVNHGYSFYAVDLRKYGRSLLPGQRMFQVRNMSEYFPDLDSALSVIREDGYSKVILMGHSTGGLTTSLYMAQRRPAMVCQLILNSPFLDWNLSKFNENFAVPAVCTIAAFAPGMRIKQGGGNAYAQSLLKKYHGLWDYDTSLKLEKSPDVDAGWINAISQGQHTLHAMMFPIGVPVLLMHSAKSVDSPDWIPESNEADGVLDVKDINKYGSLLGSDVTIFTVNGGLHDLFLSAPNVTSSLYSHMFDWIDAKI